MEKNRKENICIKYSATALVDKGDMCDKTYTV